MEDLSDPMHFILSSFFVVLCLFLFRGFSARAKYQLEGVETEVLSVHRTGTAQTVALQLATVPPLCLSASRGTPRAGEEGSSVSMPFNLGLLR